MATKTDRFPVSGDDTAAATQPAAIAAHVLALAIGIFVFFLLMGLGTLTTDAPFLSKPIGDFAAEQSSYVFVASDQWRFPFLQLPNVNMPEGANAVFFGGTPLLALIARVIGTITGHTPNLLGFWYLLCFALQAHSFFFLMRQIAPQKPMFLAVCSIAGVVAYAFLTRAGHVSLFGQFFVIYAMAFTIKTTHPSARPLPILGWIAFLAVISLLIFAYFAVSIALLFGAALAMLWWSGRLNTRGVLACGLAFTALLAIVGWAAGYVWAATHAEPTDMSSYAALGLNIGGLVIPPQSWLFPQMPLFRMWWEGDFYLGVGTLALLAILIFSKPSLTIRFLARFWPLLAVFGVLTLYSLSNRWAFGDTVLLQYHLPRWALPIVGLARAGGRLFWPVGYLVMALAFALAVRRFNRVGMVLAIVALSGSVLEATATAPYLYRLAHAPADVPLDYDGLQKIMDGHRSMQLYPSFWCDPGADGSLKRVAHWQLQITSARARQSSNSAITVRKMKDCAAEAQRMPSEILKPGEINVFLTADAFRRAFPETDADTRAKCREFAVTPGVGFMCSADWTTDTQLPLAQLKPLSDQAAGTVSAVDGIDFTSKGNWETFASGGWGGTSEGPFTWTAGPTASLRLLVPASSVNTDLNFEVFPFLAPKLALRKVDVTANGELIGTWTFEVGDWSVRKVTLPPGMTGKSILIELKQNLAPSPRDLGLSDDPRQLGLAVKSIKLSVGAQ